MAYSELLADRIRHYLDEKKIGYEAKKMMGGLCFMVDDKMCLGIIKNELMARVGEEQYQILLNKEGAKPMDFTKRPMKGYLFVEPQGFDFEEDLEFWIESCLAFNPEAKRSKKR